MQKINVLNIFLVILVGFFFSHNELGAQVQSPYEDIKNLKSDGMLIVVLHSNSLLINKLKEKAYHKQAKEEQQIQLEKNQRIVRAFKTNYSFSKLAFCDIVDIQSVMDGVGNHLLKSDLKTPLDNSGSLDFTEIYFCDPENIFMEHVEQGSLYKGMSILDSDYKNLVKPFPYFVRKHEGIFFLKRSEEEMVQVLEKKLNRFYLKGK